MQVGLCDDVHLPPLSWIMYCDPNGFWTRYDVVMEVEQGHYGQVLPPPPSHPNEGGGGGCRAKGKGRWHMSF